MIITNNMYHGAYYMAEGFNLSNVQKQYDRKLGETVVFYLDGQDEETEDKIQHKFETGTAVCNIRSYLTALVTIRDILHRTMNGAQQEGTQNERRQHKRHNQQCKNPASA